MTVALLATINNFVRSQLYSVSKLVTSACVVNGAEWLGGNSLQGTGDSGLI